MDPKKIRQEKVQRQQEIVNAAKAASRDMNAEEKTEFDSLQREIDQLSNQIEAAEKSATMTEDQKRAIEFERTRAAEITELCREFNLEPADYIKTGTSVADVRSAVIDNMKKSHAPIGAASIKDEGDKFRAAASDALLMRSGSSVVKPADGARELRSMSLKDLAIESLVREGQNELSLRRMDHDEILAMVSRQFYNPTAAFPAILDSTIEKNITQQYNEVPTTFQAWTQKGSLKDFKTTADHQYVIGGAGSFLKVPENGELKADTPSTELLPNRKLDTYGRQFSMSRQAFINDDIGFLTEIPGLYATSAKKTIDEQVYNLVYSNGNIYDGKALFHADHKNLITGAGAAPSQATIQAAILQMQKQTDPFGKPIYMTPLHLVVGVGYEFDLAVIFHSTQVTGSANNDINPLYNYPLKPIQTPVLNALAGANKVPWFLTAAPSSAKGIQVDYLNGQETPTIRRMEAPGVLGFTWDIFLDWGISVRDYRGIYKNVGATIA
jgi:hypothetical protein